MTKNLETADTISKVILAVLVLILYFAGAITGPFAHVLLALALVTMLLFLVRAMVKSFKS